MQKIDTRNEALLWLWFSAIMMQVIALASLLDQAGFDLINYRGTYLR